MLSLEWRYVNLNSHTAYLPKTKNGVPRTVPLSTSAVTLLADWPRSTSGRVFPQWSRATSLEHAWRRAVISAGLCDLRFHDLRHEAASRFFERGLNPIQVAAITGHRSLQMLKRYTHLTPEDLAVLLG
jgi:integrase